jgi:hypothetical protein
MNKEQQELLDEAYGNYCDEYWNLSSLQDKIEYGSSFYNHDTDDYTFEELTQDEFINKCKTNPEFSKKWGLKIEERELNLDERAKLHTNTEMFYDICATHFSIQDSIEYSNYPDKIWLHEQFTKGNIPTKLITITYNDIKIESYE